MRIRKLLVPSATGSVSEILRVVVGGLDEMALAIKNNSANALSAFEVHAKFHPDGPDILIASQATDFSTPLWPVRRGDALVTLGAGLTGRLWLNISGMHELILKSRTATADSTVDIHGHAN